MQQRDIDPFIVELILTYGRKAYDHRGGVRRYMDKASRQALRKELDKKVYDRLQPLLNSVVVHGVAEENVITVMHRFRRIRRV